MPGSKKNSLPSKLEETFVIIPSTIIRNTNISADLKLLLSFILGITRHNPKYFASIEFVSNLCGCSRTKATLLMKKLVKEGYIQLEYFDGRKMYYLPTSKLKMLDADISKLKNSQPKYVRQPIENKSHILINNNKSINRFNPYKNKDEVDSLIIDKISITNKSLLKRISVPLILECKNLYLKCNYIQGMQWDSKSYQFLPPLLYQISLTFFSGIAIENKQDLFEKCMINIFEELIECDSRWTKTIPSYFKMYQYWIDENNRYKSGKNEVRKFFRVESGDF